MSSTNVKPFRFAVQTSTAESGKAWREKAKQVHPDVRPGDTEAAKAFQGFQLAYEVLRQAEERREWKG